MEIENLTEGGNDLGEITPEELRKNVRLRARAAERSKHETTSVFSKMAATIDIPKPEGEKLTPEELAKAMGAKIVGRITKTLP